MELNAAIPIHGLDIKVPIRLAITAIIGLLFGIVAAGLIVISKGEVHNLTTAAHI